MVGSLPALAGRPAILASKLYRHAFPPLCCATPKLLPNKTKERTAEAAEEEEAEGEEEEEREGEEGPRPKQRAHAT